VSALSSQNATAEAAAPVQDPGQLIPVVRSTALVRCNPLTKIVVALVLMVGALLSIDLASAGVVFAFTLLALPASGLDLGAALRRLWFLPAGALLAAWGYGDPRGEDRYSRHRSRPDPHDDRVFASGRGDLRARSGLGGSAHRARLDD
jgi:hypothetical protein